MSIPISFTDFGYRLGASQFHKGAQIFECAAKVSIVVGLHNGVLHPTVRVVCHCLSASPLYCKALLLWLDSRGQKKKKEELSWKSLNPQECAASSSSHKQLMGPSQAAGVIRQVAGQGYYKTGHFPWRAEFLLFHGDWGSPTEPEITMHEIWKREANTQKGYLQWIRVMSRTAGLGFLEHLLKSHRHRMNNVWAKWAGKLLSAGTSG